VRCSDDERRRLGRGFDQILQPGQCLGIAPLQIVEDQQERVRLSGEATTQRFKETFLLPTLGQRCGRAVSAR
jgi:hypothetical protein